VGRAEGARGGRVDRSRVLARELGRELSVDAPAGRRGAGAAEADDGRGGLPRRRPRAVARRDRRRQLRRALPARRRRGAPHLAGRCRRGARVARIGMARLAVAVGLLFLAATAGGAAGFREVEQLPTHRKLVALTFDGGGDTASGTALILKTLRRHRVPATFFLAGRW